MPVFTFSGTDAVGEKVSGERIAENKDVLSAQLEREHISHGRVKRRARNSLCPLSEVRQGARPRTWPFLPPVLGHDRCRPAPGAVPGNSGAPTRRKIFPEGAERRADHGGRRLTLATAMRASQVFDDLTANMMEAGETGGILDIILQRLATT